jgi:hypothetical protein
MPGNIEILPLEVVAQAFPARPSALPDVRDFVRRQLAISDDDVRSLCERVAQVLLDAAGQTGAIQVSLRITPDTADVDVLFAPASHRGDSPVPASFGASAGFGTSAVSPGAATLALESGTRARDDYPTPVEPLPIEVGSRAVEPFAAWLAARLRREGLTMEAAARRLDVSTKTISRWVAGTTEPRLRDLYRIRETFGEPFH